MPKSFKPEFKVQGEWASNAMRFATHKEADENAKDKFRVWTLPTEYRVSESDDPVNYTYHDGRLVEVASAKKSGRCPDCGARADLNGTCSIPCGK